MGLTKKKKFEDARGKKNLRLVEVSEKVRTSMLQFSSIEGKKQDLRRYTCGSQMVKAKEEGQR